MLRKKMLSVIVGSVVLLTGLGVYIVVGSLGNSETGNQSTQSDAVSTEGVEMNSSGEENPFGEKVKTPLSEDLMRQYIHAMSHQKVRAKEKWSFFKITDERIDYLLEQLKINKYEDEYVYEDILTSWKEGDYSGVVGDHNTIWRLQDGNIGKATSPLNAEQEKKYIESQKREKR
ncbi:DUF6241 domain-containing protein [Bacillus sp. es.034]|uniref:DUF6241 domain-containing protein n=1 Tax=Bacillus sp. es.034 TaxID=1761763 RepID=UPI000BF95B44|nr:DUF6241 domain-containing protein [Bacillus sp. es.034]PFG04460.1 hypothetical protein ATG71_1204 [Bacillus sp. es.034]